MDGRTDVRLAVVMRTAETFRRQRLSLDGDWELDVRGRPTRKVKVPAPWQVCDDLRTYTGSATYRRRVVLPAEWEGRRIRLGFGAVDYRAEVEVNGAPVGRHEGGYLPFGFEIQQIAAPGAEALIEVTVTDDMSPDIPKGKQSWYGPLAGIWQSAWLEAVSDLYISGMRIDADPVSGGVSVSPTLQGEQGDHSFALQIRGPDGEAVPTEGLSALIAAPHLWDVNDPALYEVTVRLVRDGATIDSRTDHFGFRSVEARDGRIWLNGQPILLVGALDQDYYPETMCTPPSDAFLQHQFEVAKQLGLNCLRCHIKVPDPRYLSWADRMGMLIWAELPNWEALTPRARTRAKETLTGMIERDANHPSIIAWTIINESWGVDLSDASQRAWLHDMIEFVRTADPTRIVVDNSACRPNFHLGGDLNDFHFYTAIPDQRTRWDEWLKAWTNAPASTYSPHGDAAPRGDEPMVVSEFGNWGLPDPISLLEEDGAEPWWFDTGKDWAEGIVHPSGIEQRAREWKLDQTFGDRTALFKASQEHQFESLQYEVEQMRLRPQIAGFVVTEFTDLYWECNGLLDLHRRPKAGHDGYRWIFGPDLPIGVPDRRRCFVGDEIKIALHVAHASSPVLSAATLRWKLSDGSAAGEERISLQDLSVASLEEVRLRPEIPGRVRFEMELLDPSGDMVGRNWTELAIFPQLEKRAPAWSNEPAVLDHLGASGWPLDRERGVPVVTGLTPAQKPALHLAAAGDEGEGVAAVARNGTSWEGDWAQGMHWLGAELRQETPLLPRLDLTCSGMIPEAVLSGPGPAQTLSGMYVGWIHKPVATTAILRPGMVATTFPLVAAGPDDPLALSLLNNLLQAVQK